MITDRHLYEIQERVDSAMDRLRVIASAASISKLVVGDAIAAEIREVITRDLHEATEKLEYARSIS